MKIVTKRCTSIIQSFKSFNQNSAMKKVQNALLATIILLAMATNASASFLRVNNNPGINVDNKIVFSNVTAAIAAASAGDIIYLEPSLTSYGTVTFTKKLTLLGPGYFLNQNFPTATQTTSATIDGFIAVNTVTINCDGSVISGLVISGANNNSGTSSYLGANNLTFSNNILYGIEILISNLSSDNTAFYNNIILSGNYFEPNSNVSLYKAGVNGLVVTNNFFSYNSSYGDDLVSGGSTVTFSNNTYVNLSLLILLDNAGNTSYTIKNNIFTDPQFFIITDIHSGNSSISLDNNIFYLANITVGKRFSSSNPPSSVTQNNNQFNATSSIFVSPTGQSTDGQWQVLQNSSSVAYKAGTDGTDCGMFGGALPYTLSGLPAIPSIATINITGGSTITSNTNFSFSIGAQSNK